MMLPQDMFKAPTAGVFPSPRPFQDTAHLALRQGLRDGHRSQILCAPTGAGKSYCGLRLAKEAMDRGRRVTFLCDRIALIEQTSAVADRYGLTNHGIVQATHWRRDTTQPLQIASIQTIGKRGFWPEMDVLIVDECHTVYPDVVDYIASHPSTAVVGLTATPCTKGLGLHYTNLVNAATMHELTESGVLVPMRILTCVTPDMSGATISGGEWTAKSAGKAELQIVGDVVAEWVKHGEGRKTIAFGADIAYCDELVTRFNQAGINAATYTANTPESERKMLLAEFSKPDSQIRVLVSVEALAKGFDVQDIGCVIDARPLRKSLSTAIQMWGRGLRSTADGLKKDCILLDHSGNIRRFYDDFERIFFNGFESLDMAEKLDSKPRQDEGEEYEPKGCPACQHRPFKTRCLACGFQKPTQAEIGEQAGEMREIRIGKKVAASDPFNFWQQLCGYARETSKPENQSGRAWHLFKDITGNPPPREWRFDQTEGIPATPVTLGKIKSLRIAWMKGRAKGRAAA